MILEGQLLNTCKNILTRLNEQWNVLRWTINSSWKDDWDDYYFFINDDESIEIVISYGQSNWFLDKNKITLSMYRPLVNIENFDSRITEDFDNRWLKVNEDFLFDKISNFLEV